MALDVRGVQVPEFLYGTAWKEEATEGLVVQALETGFRGIDTANQRKHYFEAGVGRALARVIGDGRLRREDIFLQTKFTYVDGQDHRLPFDPGATITEQVIQSFESSLQHLGVSTLDSLVLHGPSQGEGLGAADHEAWRAMESLVDAGRARLIGISNATARQVGELVTLARIPPAFVQNRCYAVRDWDGAVRAVCARSGIVYQGFSLLTANRQVLASPALQAIAARHQRTPAQIIFRLSLDLGILPLTGTTDPTHMTQDLAARDIELTSEERDRILGRIRPG